MNSLDPRISFRGSDLQERGILWLDTWVKRIKFYSVNVLDRYDKIFGTKKNIIIRDENNQIVRHISFFANSKMSNVLREHNLIKANDGLDYKDGYTIEITSSQADTTWIKRNECCNWYWNTSKGQNTEKLTIVNNWLWHIDYYEKKFNFDLLKNWKNKVKHTPKDYYWTLQNLYDYKIAIATIKNSIDIDNLKTEISKISQRISQLENSIRELQNGGIIFGGACGATAGAISSTNAALTIAQKSIKWIPFFGESISVIFDLVSAACYMGDAYSGRRKRDILTIDNKNKFNDSIVKSINNEHLPIDNKTNFVANNITSL